MSITYLADFYAAMRLLREVRCRIISQSTTAKSIINPNDLNELITIENKLKAIAKHNGLFIIKTHQDDNIFIELDYELGEIKKDDIYLNLGEKALFKHLENIHDNFKEELEAGLQFLKPYTFHHFITDRDGTISNYCGRYQSSIQSVYNALFLSAFTTTVKEKSIIITSAPLQNIGLIDISIQPQKDFILAGSKGREFVDENGKKYAYPIDSKQQKKLDELNEAIEQLLGKAKFSSFRYIGSGLQYKFGQTTLARQDKNNAIPKQKSQTLKTEIEQLLQRLDPSKSIFRLEDTGKDLEIMLTVKTDDDKNKVEDFHKGHGIEFMSRTLDINMDEKTVLICGDTASDLPMLEAAMAANANTVGIFVTTDEQLKKEVKRICQNSLIVSTPDILVALLYLYSKA